MTFWKHKTEAWNLPSIHNNGVMNASRRKWKLRPICHLQHHTVALIILNVSWKRPLKNISLEKWLHFISATMEAVLEDLNCNLKSVTADRHNLLHTSFIRDNELYCYFLFATLACPPVLTQCVRDHYPTWDKLLQHIIFSFLSFIYLFFLPLLLSARSKYKIPLQICWCINKIIRHCMGN